MYIFVYVHRYSYSYRITLGPAQNGYHCPPPSPVTTTAHKSPHRGPDCFNWRLAWPARCQVRLDILMDSIEYERSSKSTLPDSANSGSGLAKEDPNGHAYAFACKRVHP